MSFDKETASKLVAEALEDAQCLGPADIDSVRERIASADFDVLALVLSMLNRHRALAEQLAGACAEVERSQAELNSLQAHHRRVVDQRNKDWDALMVLIMGAIGDEDDREAAELGEIEEFDPWHALRKFKDDRDSLRAQIAQLTRERDDARRKAPPDDETLGSLYRRLDEAESALAKLTRERDEAREQVRRWENCIICIECGRSTADEDGCCATCGRDCLGFEYGKMTTPWVAEHVDSIESALATARKENERMAVERDEWKACAARTATERRADEMRAIHECRRMERVYEAAVKWQRSGGHPCGEAGCACAECALWSAIDHAITTAAKAGE